jgi:hypothetical protein
LLRSWINRVRSRRSAHAEQSGRELDAARVAPRPEPSGALASSGQIARQALDLLYYGLQLSVGRIPVGERTPQTLIVVARKR